MRVLLDQGAPADAARSFRLGGWECSHVSELGMHQATDLQIVELAVETKSVVITLDADFHALLAVRRMAAPSVIRLRKEGCRAESLIAIVQPVLLHYAKELQNGCLISVKERKVTCHLLPIGGPTDS